MRGDVRHKWTYAVLAAIVSTAFFSDAYAIGETARRQRSASYSATGTFHRATGFFRLEKEADGRWVVVNPRGRDTFFRAVNWVIYDGHHNRAERRYAYRENNDIRYPDREAWETNTLSRLVRMGFNALSSADRTLMRRGLAHLAGVPVGETMVRHEREEDRFICPFSGGPCSAFPNVFHERWEELCDVRAERIAGANRDDPWLMGYVLDNELAWWGRGKSDTGMFEAVAGLPEKHSARMALDRFLEERGRSVPSATYDDKLDFLRLVADRYFKSVTEAVRRYDTNHIVMATNFAGFDGGHPIVWATAGRYCDAISFNCYPWADLDRNEVLTERPPRGERLADRLARMYELTGKPMFIHECGFSAIDSGLPCTVGSGQRLRTQELRAQAASLLARTLLAMPYVIGYSHFMWVDQPKAGISETFGENCNYGLVNEHDEPYLELTQMFTELHGRWRSHRASKGPEVRDVAYGGTCTANEFLAKYPFAGKVKCVRKGSVYSIANGNGFSLSGKIGDSRLFSSVSLDGRIIGSFGGLVSTEKDMSLSFAWLERVTDVARRKTQGGNALAVTAVGRTPETEFSVEYEFMIHPSAPQVFCRVVRVANKGKAALDLRGCYIQQHPAFKPAKQSDNERRRRGLNLYQSAKQDVWIDAKTGSWAGAFSFSPAVEMIAYVHEGHPDAIFAPSCGVRRLAPGESWQPDGTAWMLAAYGTGGGERWDRLVDSHTRRVFKLGREGASCKAAADAKSVVDGMP